MTVNYYASITGGEINILLIGIVSNINFWRIL